jgi:CO/xanthine dehydrogenase FAD-binding subunit
VDDVRASAEYRRLVIPRLVAAAIAEARTAQEGA